MPIAIAAAAPNALHTPSMHRCVTAGTAIGNALEFFESGGFTFLMPVLWPRRRAAMTLWPTGLRGRWMAMDRLQRLLRPKAAQKTARKED
ncbi:hypothetical protein [Achromobacter xylosoxidans]|uniref:hypothetical protein n=1 Tax=Alcaligenes xylosoxydans xylosoxydans TaxID=85698 RepID=UPI000B491025|nr:hypothetical protein [Achromobacter xylosoxidans]